MSALLQPLLSLAGSSSSTAALATPTAMIAVPGGPTAAQQGRDWYAWWTVFLGILLLGKHLTFETETR